MTVGQILLFTVNSIMPLVLLILLGYVLKCVGFLTGEFLKIGNKAVFYVFLPVLLFKNIADIEDLGEIRFDAVIYALCIIAVLFIVGWLMTFFTSAKEQKGVIHQCIFRSNFALIGVPLAELIGGSAGVKVAAILSLFTIPVFNILGVVVLSVYKGDGTLVNRKKIVRDIAKNPLIIGVISGLLFSLLRSALKDVSFVGELGRATFFNTAIDYVSRTATPLALIVLGGQFDFKRIVGYKKQLVLGLIGRNILAPLLGVGTAIVLKNVGIIDFGPDIFAAMIALFATPVAVSSAIMAEAMNNDGQLAGQYVVWTSLLSVASLFAVIFVCRGLGVL